MVEFKQDERDGLPKLMEINGRFWGSLQLAIDAGVDFPALLLQPPDALPSTPLPYRVGVRNRWFWGDVDSLLVSAVRRLRRAHNARSGPVAGGRRVPEVRRARSVLRQSEMVGILGPGSLNRTPGFATSREMPSQRRAAGVGSRLPSRPATAAQHPRPNRLPRPRESRCRPRVRFVRGSSPDWTRSGSTRSNGTRWRRPATPTPSSRLTSGRAAGCGPSVPATGRSS